jgi:hypothetical protein
MLLSSRRYGGPLSMLAHAEREAARCRAPSPAEAAGVAPRLGFESPALRRHVGGGLWQGPPVGVLTSLPLAAVPGIATRPQKDDPLRRVVAVLGPGKAVLRLARWKSCVEAPKGGAHARIAGASAQSRLLLGIDLCTTVGDSPYREVPVLARVRSRLSFANVTSVLALFVALGGTAYAVNTIGSADVIDNSLLSEDVKNETIASHDIRPNTIGSGRVADGSLGSQDIKDGSLTGADLGDVPVAGALSSPTGPFPWNEPLKMRTAARMFTPEPGNYTPFEIPGVGVLRANCYDDRTHYSFDFRNGTDHDVHAWMDEGDGDVAYQRLTKADRESYDDTIPSGIKTAHDTRGEAITLRIARYLSLTIWAFGKRELGEYHCTFAFQAIWAKNP